MLPEVGRTLALEAEILLMPLGVVERQSEGVAVVVQLFPHSGNGGVLDAYGYAGAGKALLVF